MRRRGAALAAAHVLTGLGCGGEGSRASASASATDGTGDTSSGNDTSGGSSTSDGGSGSETSSSSASTDGGTTGSESGETTGETSSSESTGSDSSGSTGGEEVEPCPANSTIERVSTGEYHAWPGVVFSSDPITGQGENHSPKPLEIRVTDGGLAVPSCRVRWEGDSGHGWGFGASERTGSDGELYAYWTAGGPGENRIRAVIDREGGEPSSVEFVGQVVDHASRTDSVHLYYEVGQPYTELKIRVTPRSNPPATYYSALNWTDAYAGIQFSEAARTLVIFSVWDAGGEDAAIVDAGDCNETTDFGGEGTGTSCRLRLPPSEYGQVPGLPDDYNLEIDATYELHLTLAESESGGTAHSLTFTDVTRGLGPISLGRQTTGTAFGGTQSAGSFVEEWTAHGNCLSNGRRVEYHDVSARIGGSWLRVDAASFSPNYLTNNDEICANYLAEVRNDRFFVSSGGTEDVGRPYVPGDPAFPRPQPRLTLP